MARAGAEFGWTARRRVRPRTRGVFGERLHIAPSATILTETGEMFPFDNRVPLSHGVSMCQVELTFEVLPMTESVEDVVVGQLEATVATHYGVNTVTLLVDTSDVLSGAAWAISALEKLGAKPVRLVDDLVTRGQIAERAGVTRQAVGQWVRAERHSGLPFPAPFILTSGGLWLWGEVVEALRTRGITVDDDVTYPNRLQSQRISGLLSLDIQRARAAGRILDQTADPNEPAYDWEEIKASILESIDERLPEDLRPSS